MKNRRTWLLLSLCLFGLSAWLMPRADPDASTKEHVRRPYFFRFAHGKERARMLARRQLRVASAVDGGTATARDALLVALPSHAETMVVFEAGAFMKTPIGRALVDCMESEGEGPSMQREGFDLAAVERVAFVDTDTETNDEPELIVAAGELRAIDLAKMTSGLVEGAYGEKARVFETPEGADHPHRYMAVWNDELLLAGSQRKEVQAAIDRLEGRTFDAPPIAPDDAYGEAYGHLSAKHASGFMPRAVREALGQAGLRFAFHLNADDDAVLMLDAIGDQKSARDVGRAAAAALAAARFKAIADKDAHLAQLLDFFDVRLQDSGFQLDAAFPLDFVTRSLGACALKHTEQKQPPGTEPQPKPQQVGAAGQHG